MYLIREHVRLFIFSKNSTLFALIRSCSFIRNSNSKSKILTILPILQSLANKIVKPAMKIHPVRLLNPVRLFNYEKSSTLFAYSHLFGRDWDDHFFSEPDHDHDHWEFFEPDPDHRSPFWKWARSRSMIWRSFPIISDHFIQKKFHLFFVQKKLRF